MHIVGSTFRIGVDMFKVVRDQSEDFELEKERKFEMITYNGNKGIER
jgi:hypothetical protein